MFWKLLLTGHPRRACKQLYWGFKLRFPSGRLRLHLGCGQRTLEGFVNIDYNHSRATDYVCDITHLPCPSDSVERIETYHVIEHLPHPSHERILKHWHGILTPGGRLILEFPDFDTAVRDYLDGNEERLFSIYGRQRFPGDAHLYGYNADRLCKLLASIGFVDILRKDPEDYHKDSEPCLRMECAKGK